VAGSFDLAFRISTLLKYSRSRRATFTSSWSHTTHAKILIFEKVFRAAGTFCELIKAGHGFYLPGDFRADFLDEFGLVP
jgi:hypothetical protein